MEDARAAAEPCSPVALYALSSVALSAFRSTFRFLRVLLLVGLAYLACCVHRVHVGGGGGAPADAVMGLAASWRDADGARFEMCALAHLVSSAASRFRVRRVSI